MNNAFLPILSAIIAALSALIISILTKEAKISELRQQWIDGLRTELSEFAGTAYHCLKISESLMSIKSNNMAQKMLGEVVGDNYRELSIQSNDIFQNLETLAMKITLRMNMEELNPRNLKKQIDAYVKEQENKDSSVQKIALTNLTKISQKILKKEWDRVKDGETAFKLVKCISFILSLGLIIIIILNFFQLRCSFCEAIYKYLGS